MNIKTHVKELVSDSESSKWLARAAGVLLATASIVALSFGPFPFSPFFILMWACVLAVVAVAFFWKGQNGVTAVRWWARTLGVVMGILILGIFIGEGSGGHGPPLTNIGEVLSLVPYILMFGGIIVTFFWEGIGGAMTALGGLLEQGNVLVVAHGGLNPFILVFVFVGLGSVYCWWRSRHVTQVQHAA